MDTSEKPSLIGSSRITVRHVVLWSMPKVNLYNSEVRAIFLGDVPLNGDSERQ